MMTERAVTFVVEALKSASPDDLSEIAKRLPAPCRDTLERVLLAEDALEIERGLR